MILKKNMSLNGFCPRNLNKLVRKHWTPLLVPLILVVVLTISNWPGSAHYWLPEVHGNTLGQSSVIPAPSTHMFITSWANGNSEWEIHGTWHTIGSCDEHTFEAVLHTYKVPNASTVITTHTCKFSVQISIQQLYGKTGCILETHRCAFLDGCKHLGLRTSTPPGSLSAQMLHKLFCSILTSTWHEKKKKSLQTKILWALLTIWGRQRLK